VSATDLWYPVAGVRLGVAVAGIKHPGRTDLLVIELADGGSCAAVFTRNAFCAAPVLLAREHLKQGAPRYLLVNAGNANAGTGDVGLEAARTCCGGLAEQGGCKPHQVLPFSTGVIGEDLPVERLLAGLRPALDGLDEAGWPQAAEAIMTTDTRPKLVSRRVQLTGGPVTVTGIAKGAGMICPDMATMLAYLATDAGLQPALLQDCLERAVAPSFNSISVDGDTSTNDACVLLASGRGLRIDDPEGADYRAFCCVVEAVCMELARAIVADGEGATKLVEIAIEGAASDGEARQVAYTIAHSPLVKTALFACDPNWGRILAAVGRAGVEGLDIAQVEIWLGEVCIVRNGGRDPGYSEPAGQEVMQRPELRIGVRLGRGKSEARVLTCDLSYDYVRINAEYRT
jgi:glutamate N-acetyltransferase/amino-acid N-acetyltransferase